MADLHANTDESRDWNQVCYTENNRVPSRAELSALAGVRRRDVDLLHLPQPANLYSWYAEQRDFLSQLYEHHHCVQLLWDLGISGQIWACAKLS